MNTTFTKLRLFSSFMLFGFFATTLHTNGQAPNLTWAKQWGAVGSMDTCTSMAIGRNDDMWICGRFRGTFDADPGPGVFNLTAVGINNVFFQKLDSSGNLVWAFSLNGTSTLEVSEIVTDTNGNGYTCGIFEGTVDFDPGPGLNSITSSAGKDVFVIKIDAAGNVAWVQIVEGANDQFALGLDVDPAGNVYVGCTTFGLADADPGPGVAPINAVYSTAFLLRLDSNGGYILSAATQSNEGADIRKIRLDDFGNVYLLGAFFGTVDFDPGAGVHNLAVPVGGDWFLWKLNIDGSFDWVFPFGLNGVYIDYSSMVIDPFGNPLLEAQVWDPFDMDPGPLVNMKTPVAPWGDIYFAAFDSTGQFKWGDLYGAYNFVEARKLAVDLMGNVYLTGIFSSVMDVNPGPGVFNVVAGGFWDYATMVVKFDPYGNFVWGSSYAAPAASMHTAIDLNQQGDIFLAGTFFGGNDLDPGPGVYTLPAPSDWNIFAARWKQDSCSSLTILIDSIVGLNCAGGIGHAAITTLGGLPPYTFLWNTTPPVSDSFADFQAAGLYSIAVTDNRQCQRSLSIPIAGPSTAGFDLGADLLSWNLVVWDTAVARLSVYNRGCAPTNGILQLIMPDSVTYLSASVSPFSISGDTLSWTFSSLTFDSGPIIVDVYYDIDNLVPPGSFLCFTSIVTPVIGDLNPFDNFRNNYCFVVRGSFDPNDKSVYPRGECSNHYVQQGVPLTYTIRFQNTGNATAQMVYILDTLDAGLGANSIVVKGFSHPMETTVLPGNVVKFNFPFIYLPDSTSDEPGSHGYVIYEIAPQTNLPTGTEIRNRSSIFFDFNLPILTNQVWSTIVAAIPPCTVIGTVSQNEGDIVLFPNPASGLCTIRAKSTLEEIAVTDLVGKQYLHLGPMQDRELKVDVAQWPAGIYFFRVRTSDKTEIIKFVHQ